MTETSTDKNSADLFDTPGKILCSRREKLDLTLQEIAKRLHLDVKIIVSIENDSHEGMPAATYVRGYLRSYAKIVGADADNIIQLYNSDSPQPPPEILPEVKPPTQVSSRDKPVMAFTYLITLGLVLLLLIWYQSNFVVNTSTNGERAINNTATSINGVDITYDVITHPDSWQFPEYIPEEDIEIDPAAPIPANQDNGEQPIEIMLIDDIDKKSSTSTTGHGSDTIDLKLTHDSWIEIYDANNKRLFRDLALGGEHHSINGTAPFNVKLGFSIGIIVEFNGKLFDPSPYSNNGIARFTLPEQ